MIPTALTYDLAKQRERDIVAAANRPRRHPGSSSSHVDRPRLLHGLAGRLGLTRGPRARLDHERHDREEILS